MADSRRGHGQQRGGKRVCRWIEYFRGASVVTASDKDLAAIKERRGMSRPRRAHGGEHVEARAVKNLGGIYRPISIVTAGNENPAICQERRGVINARSSERCAGDRGFSRRIKDF